MIRNLANRGMKNQVRGPKDYLDQDGLLVCGDCGERKQIRRSFPDPTPDEPDRMTELLLPCACRCQIEAEERAEKEAEAKRELEAVGRLRAASLMDERFRQATFANFIVDDRNQRNLKLCKSYADRFPEMLEKNQGLLLWGAPGVGKTYAAACIANALLEKRVPVMMTSFIRLLSLIQSGREQEEDILARMSFAKLVIFDDLGAERNTGYALEKVYEIVDDRYRKGLPSIFTTNLALTDIQGETDLRYSRIYDRVLSNCYPMHFTGQSWRQIEASRRYEEMAALLEGA